MKAEGVLSGAADLFLAMPAKGFSGLFIEMKAEKGRQTPAQKDFEKRVIFGGYDYKICRSFDEFKELIINYLK